VWGGSKLRENVVRSSTSDDMIANRVLPIGCSPTIALIVTPPLAAVR
jgi:hypothetical protein